MAKDHQNRLGAYLRSRREKLDPSLLGIPPGPRRTPGLRREEVAQRARISPTWYTWLEQGHGGAASADVLDRIAQALTLTNVEREHLFLLGTGRPPGVSYDGNPPFDARLQRQLDAMPYSPAIVRTATWDVLAWNSATAIVLGDYGMLPPGERNVLRMFFVNPQVRAMQADWEGVARAVVAGFRIDVARAGAEADVQPLVKELCARCPEFGTIWQENDVQAFGGTIKRLIHPMLGPIDLEYSSFAIEGRLDLAMVVHNPATAEDRSAIQSLVGSNEAFL